MDNNHNIPTKKRKANDGSAKAADGAHDVSTNNDSGGFLSSWLGYYFSGRRGGTSSAPSSGDQINQSLLSQMERMEKIMIRVEEKLASVSSLESRCEQLEAKCSSLENILETKIDLSHDKLETKLLRYHECNKMLVKNQSWEYSAPVRTLDHWLRAGYNYEEAEYMSENSESLKDKTMEMRAGEFPDDGKGIIVEFCEVDPIFSYAVNDELLPHWKEFAGALKQFTPALNLLPDDCDSFFDLINVQMNNDAMNLIKNALIGKPFRDLCFQQNKDDGGSGRGGMSADAIIDITKSNKHLRQLSIDNYQMGRNDVEELSSAVRDHPSLTRLYLENCFRYGVGDVMLRSLIATASNLERLSILNNGITSSVGAMLSEFLAMNPKLTYLDLERNNLNDSDAVLIANALRTNSTLRFLGLSGNNNISRIGIDALSNVLHGDSSLNARADSNHICRVTTPFLYNIYANPFEGRQINRGSKIYSLLSSRNRTMSNVKHFDDIDVKLLPNMLEAVQKYANTIDSDGRRRSVQSIVNDLSIVYEVMRKWERERERVLVYLRPFLFTRHQELEILTLSK